MGLESIGRGAEELLKSKTFGGVSKESALEAINKVKSQANEIVGKVREELEAIKGKSAQEIAELTSKKDRLELQLKNVKNARSSEKTLANGDKIIRKVNQNGAVMEKQLNSDGKLLRVEVTTLDGAKRRTTYNPTTEKPIKTYTDTTGEDILIKYNDNGAAPKTEKVNNKKTRRTQAKLVDTRTDNSGVIQRTYSDGVKEIISTDHNAVISITREKNGKVLSQQLEGRNGIYKTKNKQKTSEASIKFSNNLEYKKASMTVAYKPYGIEIIKAETETLRGESYKLEKIKNRFGQDMYMYKLTKTDSSGNVSFEEIAETKIQDLLKNSTDNVIHVKNAAFFTPKSMINIANR